MYERSLELRVSSTVHNPGRQDGPKNSDKVLICFSTKVPSIEQISRALRLITAFSSSCRSNGVMISSYLKPGWQYFFPFNPAIPPVKSDLTITTVCAGVSLETAHKFYNNCLSWFENEVYIDVYLCVSHQ